MNIEKDNSLCHNVFIERASNKMSSTLYLLFHAGVFSVSKKWNINLYISGCLKDFMKTIVTNPRYSPCRINKC